MTLILCTNVMNPMLYEPTNDFSSPGAADEAKAAYDVLLEYAAEATAVDISGGDGNQYEEGSLAAVSKTTLAQHCMVTCVVNLLLETF